LQRRFAGKNSPMLMAAPSHRNGRIVTFAFLYNGKAAPYLVRKLYDDLCEELAAPEESTPGKPRPAPRPSAQRR
jgi:hypothetical protein